MIQAIIKKKFEKRGTSLSKIVVSMEVPKEFNITCKYFNEVNKKMSWGVGVPIIQLLFQWC